MENKEKLELLIMFVENIANTTKACLCGVSQINPKHDIPKGSCIICQAGMLLKYIGEIK